MVDESKNSLDVMAEMDPIGIMLGRQTTFGGLFPFDRIKKVILMSLASLHLMFEGEIMLDAGVFGQQNNRTYAAYTWHKNNVIKTSVSFFQNKKYTSVISIDPGIFSSFIEFASNQ